MDAVALELPQIWNVGAPVAGAGSHDHRACPHRTLVGKRDGNRIVGDRVTAVTLETRRHEGNGYFGAKFLGLTERPPGQRLSRYPGREAEVVFDACRCTGLAAYDGAVDHKDGQPLRCRIDSRGKTCWPRSDHGHVIKRAIG